MARAMTGFWTRDTVDSYFQSVAQAVRYCAGSTSTSR